MPRMSTSRRSPFRMKLASILAERRLRHVDLAHALGMPSSTLGGYLTHVVPSPPDLHDRIEKVLKLDPGTLPPEEASPLLSARGAVRR